MVSFQEMRALGTPFCVYSDLGAGSESVLVTPKAAGAMAGGIGNTEAILNTQRIIILGYQYDFVAGNNFGFDLVARSSAYSPGGTSDLRILEPRATTAVTRVEGGSDSCFIPLDQGGISSPGAGPTLYNPASLVVTPTGTAPTSGHLVVWGVLADGSESFVINHNIYGEAFNAGSPPPY